MCKISVIIPVYNTEQYLERCINSVLEQSFNDYEVILVDDESTDGSGLICDMYEKKYSCVKTIHTNNGGPARARKIGFENSNGQYIMFMDSDDYVSTDIMKEMHESVGEADIVCSNFFKVKNGNIEKQPFYKQNEVLFETTHDILYEFFTKRYINGALWAKLIKRELFDNLDFCEEAIIGEDINMMLQLYEKANEIKCLSKPLYFYFHNDEGISHSGYTDKHRFGLEYYIKFRKEIVNKYPELSVVATGYFAEYEMAALTAMCRNDIYDPLVIKMLQNDLKDNLWNILINRYTALYFKMSAVIIIINSRLFCNIFSRIRKVVGR